MKRRATVRPPTRLVRKANRVEYAVVTKRFQDYRGLSKFNAIIVMPPVAADKRSAAQYRAYHLVRSRKTGSDRILYLSKGAVLRQLQHNGSRISYFLVNCKFQSSSSITLFLVRRLAL